MKTIEHYRANGINYDFVLESDGWWSIYEINDGLPPKPLLQASDLEHCISYAQSIEKLDFQAKKLLEE